LRCDESPSATASFTNRSIMYASGNPRPQPTKVSHVRFLEPSGGPNRRRNNRGGRLDDNASTSGSDRDDDEDSVDEEERLDRELSRQHGEAVEARVAGSSKRPAASANAADAEDQEIDALYQKAKRAKSKRAPDLTVESLTGPEGLIRIQTDFFRPDHLPQLTKASTASVASSAQFALSVVEAYKSFCFHLMPQLAFEDSLLKIERFGSKRPVKKYLDEMRHSERNKHVSKVLGDDRAHRVLQELHDAMQEHQHLGGGSDEPEHHGPSQAGEEDAGGGEDDAADIERGAPTPRQAPPAHYDDEREEEQEATFAEESEEAATDRNDALSSAPGSPEASRTSPVQGATRNAPVRLVLDDTDSENELDDENGNEDNVKGVTASRKSVGTDDAPPSSGTAAASASQRRHRFVMRDDDDGDEDVDSETESMVDKNGEDNIAARPEAESTADSPAKERGPMGAPNDGAAEAPAGLLRDVAPATGNSPLDDDSATVLLRDASDSESNKKESFLEADEGPGSGSPAQAQPVFAMPSAQDSPLESIGSPSSSPTSSSSSSPASPASPSKLSSTTHLAMMQRSIDSPSRIVHEHGDPPCDSDDETATLVPSTLTGPTQWGDDDEDDVEENDGTVDITM
jgi:Replication Fork Protection Component Swi3